MDYKKDILLFPSKNKNLFVTEFCRSRCSIKKECYTQIRKSYILHILIKGCVDFRGTKINEGTAFLFSKNKPYDFSFHSGFDHFWIGFSGEGAEKLLSSFNISSNNHVLLNVENINYLKEYLGNKMKLLKETPNEKEALCVLLTLLAHLSPLENEFKMNHAEGAKTFIDNNYPYQISMEDVAKRINISEKHLYRIFKKRFGISPQKYLMSVRMTIAKQFLLDTDMMIKEITENVGFTSQFAFSTAYKKFFGISPSSQRSLDAELKTKYKVLK